MLELAISYLVLEAEVDNGQYSDVLAFYYKSMKLANIR